MNKQVIVGLVSACCLAGVASGLIPLKSANYYRLNGGSDLALPPISDGADFEVGGNVDANLGLSSCYNFNPALSISHTIGDLSQSIEGISGTLINNVTSAAMQMGMYELEKTDPKLYNLFQNAINGANETFHLHVVQCTDQLTKNGQLNYSKWFSVADSNGWLSHTQAVAQGGDVDVNAASKDVAKKGPEYGVQWVHQAKSGGSIGQQVPIKVISDVAMAGYNILVDPNRPLDDQDPPAPKANPELTRFWATPKQAGAFARLVLGDITITTKKSDQDQATQAGVGLVSLLTACPATADGARTCVKTLRDHLVDWVTHPDQVPTPADLEKVSANALTITPEVVEGLRNLDGESRALYINRIAQDLAIQNLIDEALLLRRLLIAGSQAQVVQNLKPALAVIHDTIARLDKDIQNVLFEHQVRSQISSNTLANLMSQLKDHQIAAETGEGQAESSAPVHNGAVYQPNHSQES